MKNKHTNYLLKVNTKITRMQAELEKYDYWEVKITHRNRGKFHWEGYALDRKHAYETALEDMSYIDIFGNREHITIEPEDITEMETIKSVKPTRENLKKVSKEQFQWGLFCGVFASCIVVLIGIVILGGMHQ